MSAIGNGNSRPRTGALASTHLKDEAKRERKELEAFIPPKRR
jgi:hypothetical protein